MEVLQLDVSGRPQAWISAKDAAIIYASDGIAWTLGDTFYVLRGGMQRRTGLQSRIEVHGLILALHHDARFLRNPVAVERVRAGFDRVVSYYATPAGIQSLSGAPRSAKPARKSRG